MAQLVSGPMAGPAELREAKIWIACKNAEDIAVLKFGKKGAPLTQTAYQEKGGAFDVHTTLFYLTALEPGTTYDYEVTITAKNRMVSKKRGTITTKTLFQWRQPAPDFSFLTGSCAYFNEPPYDRPGKPYGQDSSIFMTMAREKAAFMLWLGDNWYTREVDFHGPWGLWYRAAHDRSMPVLQPLLAAMPHLAIWDDHDYGPNDYGKSYHLKETSRNVFKAFWPNHSFGEKGEGIYSRYQHNDADFFLLDDRWWRDNDRLPDSINGQPNPDKRMLGKQQLEWLKQELLFSKSNPFISFRIIVLGSQVFNPVSPFDKLSDFSMEYNELIQFIRSQKIDGVVFLNGDRHHSEVLKLEQAGHYPLYEITCSPLTSGTHAFGGPEANNPYRVAGVDKLQNYGRISLTGARNQRVLKVEFIGLKGDLLGTYSIRENELKIPR